MKLKSGPGTLKVPEVRQIAGILGGYLKQKLIDFHKLCSKNFHHITQKLKGDRVISPLFEVFYALTAGEMTRSPFS